MEENVPKKFKRHNYVAIYMTTGGFIGLILAAALGDAGSDTGWGVILGSIVGFGIGVHVTKKYLKK